MYRRPKFLEVLDEVREEMSRDADYDVSRFAEMVTNGEPVAARIALHENFEVPVVGFVDQKQTIKSDVLESFQAAED